MHVLIKLITLGFVVGSVIRFVMPGYWKSLGVWATRFIDLVLLALALVLGLQLLQLWLV